MGIYGLRGMRELGRRQARGLGICIRQSPPNVDDADGLDGMHITGGGGFRWRTSRCIA